MVSLIRQVATTMTCCCLAGWALAASPAGPSPGHPLLSDIPAQPLPGALQAFIGQTGLQLVYLSTLADGKVSRGAPAGLPADAAMARLLAGTGLDFSFLNSRTISIVEGHPARSGGSARSPPALPLPPNLPDLIVTAAKREEFLRDVPVSATVLSGEAMSEAGITTMADIAAVAPGVEYDFNAQWGGGVLTNVAIRGIDSKVGTSTTGIYFNDAPIQARNGNFGNPYPVTFDLARVEVLRGPQGTLFGAGAEGGAIRFITTEPSTTAFSTLSRLELASTQDGGMSFEAGAAVGGPLIDGRLGARLTAWYRDDAGYVDRVDPFTGAPIDRNSNDTHTDALRLSVAAEPTESLRMTPMVAHQSLRNADTSSFYQYLSDPGAGQLRNGKLLSQPRDDDFTLASVKLDYRFAAADLTIASSYFDRTATATIDTTNEAGAIYYGGFGNPLGAAYPTSYADAVPSLTSLHQIVLSQEVRLASSDPDAPLRWTAGLFYSRARQDDRQYTYPIATPANPGVYSNEHDTDTLSSGFGNLELLLAPNWKTRLGVRIDDARSEVLQYAGGFADAGTPPYSKAIIDEKPVTPQFTLEYAAADHNLVYASIAKGFRIGGINTPLPIQCGLGEVPSSYASDSVWSYEIGTKGRAFGDRLQLAASAFYLRWHDIQEHEVPACGFGYVANAGEATGKGVDFSLDAALTDGMTAGLAAESVDVRYDETVFANGELIVDRGAIVGGVPHVPSPWNGTVYLRYQRSLTAFTEAYARAEENFHSHNPGPFSELDPRSISYSPRYTADPATDQLNLQVGLSWSHWDLKLFVNNALNSLPVLQRNADSGTSSLIYAYSFRPRTGGVTTMCRF